MKISKKLLAIVLTIIVLFSFTACHYTTPAVVVNVNGTDISSGIYLMYQYEAYNNAMTAYSDELYASGADDVTTDDVDITSATIEGITGAEWIKNETDRLLKEYVYVNVENAETDTLTDEEISIAQQSAKDTFSSSYVQDVYESNGIGEQSYADYYVTQTAYYNLLTNYTEAESENISEDDAKAYMDETYKQINTLSLPVTNAEGTDLDDAGKAAVQEIADNLEAELKSGGDLDELAEDALKEAFEICGVEYTEDTLTQYNTTYYVTDDFNYYFDAPTVQAIMASSVGDAGQVESDVMPLVYSVIPNYTDDEQFVTDFYDSIVSTICNENFESKVAEDIAEYTVTEYGNARSTYSVKNIEA